MFYLCVVNSVQLYIIHTGLGPVTSFPGVPASSFDRLQYAKTEREEGLGERVTCMTQVDVRGAVSDEES